MPVTPRLNETPIECLMKRRKLLLKRLCKGQVLCNGKRIDLMIIDYDNAIVALNKVEIPETLKS